MKRLRQNEIVFEDSLSDDWSRDLEVMEVPLGNRPLFYLRLVILAVVAAVGFQVIYLNWSGGRYYGARAGDNMAQNTPEAAPRGLIYDRQGQVLAESKAAFAAELDIRLFFQEESLRANTAAALQDILHLSPDELAGLINNARTEDFATPIVLRENLNSSELVQLQALNLPTIKVVSEFARHYPQGPVFSSVIGYTGRVNQRELKKDPTLTGNDFIGKTGIEAYYDSTLRGTPGITVQYRDAQGQVLREERKSTPAAGAALHLTIDGGLQAYFYSRLASGLRALGRPIGLGIALNPQNGEVLSLVNLPGFNNNLFTGGGTGTVTGTSTVAEIQRLLASPDKPLFDRAVNGFYNPGSTIKPLDAVALLKEGIIDPARTIFSNGVLLVPNPYNSSTPSRYLDWRYQGSVNLAGALAQSSDVYFYVTVGGSPAATTPLLNDPSDYGVKGLGIARLNEWWQKFGLGRPTGIDMPNESEGFLPTPAWKEKRFGTPWLLGDTYNVSIGQGDLLVSPFQLLNYISAIANGGTIYRPFLNSASTPQVAIDLTSLAPQIAEVQRGMRAGVTSPQGTSHSLNDLPVCVGAKTGSAQVQNNEQENALFVGYAPCEHPQIALLILIENSREGSLNTLPIAKDVLNWYYWNRIAAGPAAGKSATSGATSAISTGH